MLHRLRTASKLAACAALFACALGVQPVAVTQSAVMYRVWTEPGEPITGQPVAIHIATHWPDSQGQSGSPKPLNLPDFPWSVVADSPAGVRHAITISRVSGSGNEWSGTFSFDEPGQWEVGLDPRHLGK